MKEKTHVFAICLVVACTFLTSFGQYFIKKGAVFITSNVFSLLNPPFIIGCVLYAASAIIMVIALKYGELSVLYPIIALSFVWVFLLSILFLGEPVFLVHWAGLVLIIGGVSLMGRGARQ